MSRKRRSGSPLSYNTGLGSPSPPLASGTVHSLKSQVVGTRSPLDTPSWLPSFPLSVSMALTM